MAISSSSDARIGLLERAVDKLRRAVQDLTARVGRVEQLVPAVQGTSGGGSGGGGGVWVCVTPSSGSWPGGAPPGGTPGSFTADVFTISGGAYVAGPTAQTIYVPYPSSPLNSRVVTLARNSDGTFTELGESCS